MLKTTVDNYGKTVLPGNLPTMLRSLESASRSLARQTLFEVRKKKDLDRLREELALFIAEGVFALRALERISLALPSWLSPDSDISLWGSFVDHLVYPIDEHELDPSEVSAWHLVYPIDEHELDPSGGARESN